ncbi:hypothetical protein [Streptomyces chiangmaiensis]|uniref:Secreted protein n=1 Tax=Streptomyces chiangmaiensis TaxID=766497 RepID=A0ABU7FD64_9ACTN|nr:hypothetical protein [Streptomyces chiangmaiensis]MED7821854.1 hypothetical protein [Streptomyces chiangmaiensis]
MRYTAAALAVAAFVLTGCSNASSGSDGSVKPATTADHAASAEQIAACTDALVARKDDTADDGTPECKALSPEDYLKALQAAKQKAQDASKEGGDAASASPQG